MITMAIDLCQQICENKIKVNMRKIFTKLKGLKAGVGAGSKIS